MVEKGGRVKITLGELTRRVIFLTSSRTGKKRSKKMNLIKVIWRLTLCSLFFIGLTYGLPAYAAEPEGPEKAAHETHESTEAVEHEETKAAEEAQETKAAVEHEETKAAEEAQETKAAEEAHGEEETHETEKGH
jgi:hypothetical protein